jgi:hypothetical protein
MPRADSIGSNPFSFRALKVVRPRHSPNFGQLARDLDAEAQYLETVGHDDGAVHTSQIGHQVGHLEQRFVHLAQLLGTTPFVSAPSDHVPGVLVLGEFVRGCAP